mmetsp:Transcript_37619/g.106262  ORF Transcript_37619/g.106262 Transcript_37619/m.106262 type:complete len:361 (-) Transcript_37619:65-1147(-)
MRLTMYSAVLFFASNTSPVAVFRKYRTEPSPLPQRASRMMAAMPVAGSTVWWATTGRPAPESSLSAFSGSMEAPDSPNMPNHFTKGSFRLLSRGTKCSPSHSSPTTECLGKASQTAASLAQSAFTALKIWERRGVLPAVAMTPSTVARDTTTCCPLDPPTASTCPPHRNRCTIANLPFSLFSRVMLSTPSLCQASTLELSKIRASGSPSDTSSSSIWETPSNLEGPCMTVTMSQVPASFLATTTEKPLGTCCLSQALLAYSLSSGPLDCTEKVANISSSPLPPAPVKSPTCCTLPRTGWRATSASGSPVTAARTAVGRRGIAPLAMSECRSVLDTPRAISSVSPSLRLYFVCIYGPIRSS